MSVKRTAKVSTQKAGIRAQGRLRRLRGKVDWEGDLEQSRLSRVSTFELPKTRRKASPD